MSARSFTLRSPARQRVDLFGHSTGQTTIRLESTGRACGRSHTADAENPLNPNDFRRIAGTSEPSASHMGHRTWFESHLRDDSPDPKPGWSADSSSGLSFVFPRCLRTGNGAWGMHASLYARFRARTRNRRRSHDVGVAERQSRSRGERCEAIPEVVDRRARRKSRDGRSRQFTS